MSDDRVKPRTNKRQPHGLEVPFGWRDRSPNYRESTNYNQPHHEWFFDNLLFWEDKPHGTWKRAEDVLEFDEVSLGSEVIAMRSADSLGTWSEHPKEHICLHCGWENKNTVQDQYCIDEEQCQRRKERWR